MDKDKSQPPFSIIKGIGQILSLARLYNLHHPTVKIRISDIFQELTDSILSKESLIFAEAGGTLLINGEEIKAQDTLIKSFAKNLRDLGLGSLGLQRGLSLDEFNVFIDLLNNTEHLQGETRIKEYLKKNGVKHVVPSFATYKLVKENESIVKEESILRLEKLTPEVTQRFSEELNKAQINKLLQEGDKIYQILAHEPGFLSNVVFDLAKDKDNTEELVKILWLIGDYLINEISTAKQEEINRKVIAELKDRLLSLWEQKQESLRWKEKTQNTFAAINAALQIEGLILLYKKHKKEVEAVTEKLKQILSTIPQESQLYRKTKENLEKIGLPSLDIALFKTDTPP